MRQLRALPWLSVVGFAAFTLLGCAEETATSGQAAPPPREKEKAEASPKKAAEAALPVVADFQETEFTENERSRDPFRSFANMFVAEARGRVKSQREVVLEQYSVDELKLIGIVTRLEPARAMLVDPTGIGHVLTRGQFVGRPEVVQAGTQGGAAYEINWRVDRIREGDVVLIREDPANPDVPSATKVIPLRPEGEVTVE
jgi:type IV pilus assembly protein PilP